MSTSRWLIALGAALAGCKSESITDRIARECAEAAKLWATTLDIPDPRAVRQKQRARESVRNRTETFIDGARNVR